jgi:glycosyltransferase involved in cell wall biosynthesis
MGCNIVITDKGFTRDYFDDLAYYCDPADPVSIFNAVEMAAKNPARQDLQKRVREKFTWEIAASYTLQAYQAVLNGEITK